MIIEKKKKEENCYNFKKICILWASFLVLSREWRICIADSGVQPGNHFLLACMGTLFQVSVLNTSNPSWISYLKWQVFLLREEWHYFLSFRLSWSENKVVRMFLCTLGVNMLSFVLPIWLPQLLSLASWIKRGTSCTVFHVWWNTDSN